MASLAMLQNECTWSFASSYLPKSSIKIAFPERNRMEKTSMATV